MSSEAIDDGELDGGAVVVRLPDYPLVLGERASAHYAEALREMTLLVAAGKAPAGSVPDRVTRLAGELTELRELTTGFDSEKAAALGRGEATREMTVAVTPRMVAMSEQLDALLDEIDDYCRNERVLTLAPDDELVRYRRWYVEQLRSQTRGGQPAPWAGATT